MIVLLYGPDDYRRGEKRKNIAREFVKKHSGLGVERFDLEGEDELSRFRNFIENQSIFEPTKLAVLENGLQDPAKEFIAELKKLKDEPKTTILISQKERPIASLGFLLKEPVMVQKFEYLTGAEQEVFIKMEAAREHVTLSDPALHFLGDLYGKDTWRLVTELRKIAFLGKSLVEKEDLERSDLELAPDFWTLVNGLRSGRLEDRMKTFERFLAMNEPPAKIFNILAYQWPEKFGAFAEYDGMVKSGKFDYEEALVDLLIS